MECCECEMYFFPYLMIEFLYSTIVNHCPRKAFEKKYWMQKNMIVGNKTQLNKELEKMYVRFRWFKTSWQAVLQQIFILVTKLTKTEYWMVSVETSWVAVCERIGPVGRRALVGGTLTGARDKTRTRDNTAPASPEWAAPAAWGHTDRGRHTGPGMTPLCHIALLYLLLCSHCSGQNLDGDFTLPKDYSKYYRYS